MNVEIDLSKICDKKGPMCPNCKSHFMVMRPLIRQVLVSKHFQKDMKNESDIMPLVEDVLDCSHEEFSELHKFEESVDGIKIFRAKKGRVHIVYAVDRGMRIIFLRALRNFKEYKRFLSNKKEILAIASSS
jgi:mRNA-degrading endonuclease RelE of RelBE toxin-antitoxin system